MTRLVTFLMASRASGLAGGGFLRKAADSLRAAASGGPPPPALQLDAAPSWDALQQTLDAQTPAEEIEIAQQVAAGRGPPTASANLRLFDAPDGYEPRVTLYRDGSSWCPYCQKVWMQLEEKRIPYKVERCVEINQRVGCTGQFFTKSFLGDDTAVLAPSSGEEPASPRHRAGVASMAWRTTRRPSTNAP